MNENEINKINKNIKTVMLVSIATIFFNALGKATILFSLSFGIFMGYSDYPSLIITLIIIYAIIYAVYVVLLSSLKSQINKGNYYASGKIFVACGLSYIFGGIIGLIINSVTLGIIYYKLTQQRYLDKTHSKQRPFIKIGLEDNLDKNITSRLKIIKIVAIVFFVLNLFSNVIFYSTYSIFVLVFGLVVFLKYIKQIDMSLHNRNIDITLILVVSAIGATYASNVYVAIAFLVVVFLLIRDITNLQTVAILDEEQKAPAIEMSDNEGEAEIPNYDL